MKVEHIVIHASDTYPDMDVDAGTIRNWHVHERGWSDIGYHWVITRNKGIQEGRRGPNGEFIPGAHVKGLNHNSLGICMVGGKAREGELACNYTAQQWVDLIHLYKILSLEFPEAIWSGHNDHDKNKNCPLFDVKSFISSLEN